MDDEIVFWSKVKTILNNPTLYGISTISSDLINSEMNIIRYLELLHGNKKIPITMQGRMNQIKKLVEENKFDLDKVELHKNTTPSRITIKETRRRFINIKCPPHSYITTQTHAKYILKKCEKCQQQRKEST